MLEISVHFDGEKIEFFKEFPTSPAMIWLIFQQLNLTNGPNHEGGLEKVKTFFISDIKIYEC